MEERFGISTKKFMLEELKDKFRSSNDFIITNYKGLRSPDIEGLRRNLTKSASKYFVVKNSIAKRALDELKLKELDRFIQGEVGIGFVGDVLAASKTLVDFSKAHPSFKLKGAFIDGQIESTERIKYLATLPPREALLGLALSYMKSPVTGFVGVLKGLMRNLVYAVSEIKNKKGGKENG